MNSNRIGRVVPTVLALLIGVALVGAQTGWSFVDPVVQWLRGDTGYLLIALAGWATFAATKSKPVLAIAVGQSLIFLNAQVVARFEVPPVVGTLYVVPLSLMAAMYFWGGGQPRVKAALAVLGLLLVTYPVSIFLYEPVPESHVIVLPYAWLQLMLWVVLLAALWLLPTAAQRWLSLVVAGQFAVLSLWAFRLPHELFASVFRAHTLLTVLGYGLTFWWVYRTERPRPA